MPVDDPSLIRLKRGSQAELEAAATAGDLSAGEPYFIDSETLAIGTGPSAFVTISGGSASGGTIDGGSPSTSYAATQNLDGGMP